MNPLSSQAIAPPCSPSFLTGLFETCITSPPYWSLRDYGIQGQIGLEMSLSNYIASLVDIFEQVRRVLRDDGTLWLNIGTHSRQVAEHGARPTRRTPSELWTSGRRHRTG